MNKEIQKLQEEIKERMDKIEKLLEPSDYKQWVPKVDGRYYTLNGHYSPLCTYWTDKPYDIGRKKNYALFKTEEEAERIADIQRIQRKIIDIIKFVIGDWRPDWKDADQEKCYINFDHLYKTMEVSYSYRYQKLTNKMYFSREHQNKALELINKHLTQEEIETYWG